MKSKRDFEKNMRRLMKLINSHQLDITSLSDEEIECLYECVNRNYIRGIHLKRNILGKLIGGVDGNIIVLYDGFVFLSRPELKANVSLVVSIIALVLSLLVAFTPFPDISKEIIQTIFTP